MRAQQRVQARQNGGRGRDRWGRRKVRQLQHPAMLRARRVIHHERSGQRAQRAPRSCERGKLILFRRMNDWFLGFRVPFFFQDLKDDAAVRGDGEEGDEVV